MVDKKNAKNAKNAKKYYCEKCDFLTCKKSNWNKHITTAKHKMLTNVDDGNKTIYKCVCGKKYAYRQSLHRHKMVKKCEKMLNDNSKMVKNGKNGKKMVNVQKCPKMTYSCICGKIYKYQGGLSRHKSYCAYTKDNIVLDKDNVKLQNMVKDLLIKNEELMIKCTELAEKPTNITTNNNTQFNIMNYLNTECKDAMNLTDFIDSFEFSLKDLQVLSTKGYQESMKNTFIKKLCDMEKTKRPIHCSDKKRKSFYIKDNDVWEKDRDNIKLIRGMKNLSFIHNTTLNKWKNKNEDWNSNERKQIFYCNSILEFAKCDKEKERNKILSKLVNLTIK